MKSFKILSSLAAGMVCSLMIIGVSAATLVDIKGHVYEDQIADIQARGIVQGYSDNTYKPDAAINRAEFTKIVVGAKFSQAEIDACVWGDALTDIPAGIWYQQYVCIAAANQIIGGYPDGTFQGSNTINFAEAAKIMVKTFDIPYQEDTDLWYRGYIEALGTIEALPKSYNQADQSVTRGEMAFMVSQTLRYKEGRVPSSETSYTDLTPPAAASRIGNGTPVLVFFHASWCPHCREKHEWLTTYYGGSNNATVSVVKVDYDAAVDLKRQQGVTQQDTFILYDAEGEELDRASFPSIEKLQDMLENGVT